MKRPSKEECCTLFSKRLYFQVNKRIQLFVVVLAGALAFSGCAKQKDSIDPSVFAGTWSGTLTCAVLGVSASTVTISMSGSTAVIAGQSGAGVCAKAASFTGTLFNDHLVFSPQLTVDNCGNSNSFSASVYYNQNVLTLSESISGPALTTTCSFTGTKQ